MTNHLRYTPICDKPMLVLSGKIRADIKAHGPLV